MDDIPTDHAASRTESTPDQPSETGAGPEPQRRQIGPESEVRGGPEAADEALPGDKAGRSRRDKQ